MGGKVPFAELWVGDWNKTFYIVGHCWLKGTSWIRQWHETMIIIINNMKYTYPGTAFCILMLHTNACNSQNSPTQYMLCSSPFYRRENWIQLLGNLPEITKLISWQSPSFMLLSYAFLLCIQNKFLVTIFLSMGQSEKKKIKILNSNIYVTI